MRQQLLNYIRCPICASTFDLIIIEENETEIEKGLLICKGCGYASEFSDGVVNLLYGLDSHTIRELYLHIQDRKELFDVELKSSSLEEVERRWAYMEQATSEEYGEKIKQIFNAAIKRTLFKETDVILDLGIGTGWSTAQIAKMGGECIGIDLCKSIKLELSKVFLENEDVFFERCIANMMRLPISDNCIDKVVCVASLHHASDLSVAMGEISRVLKDEGELILIGEPVVPFDYLGKDIGFMKEKQKGFNEHQYTAKDWFRFAENAGLFAKDGTRSSDDLNKYYMIGKDGLQNPLPIFVKKSDLCGKSLRIALLSQEFSADCTGGICKYTYDLARMLGKLGHEIHVVSRSPNSTNYSWKEDFYTIHFVCPESCDFLGFRDEMPVSRKNLDYSYAAYLKLMRLIEEKGIQIVEAPLWDAEGFIFSLFKPVPLVVRIETPLFKVVEIQEWGVNKDLKFANWMEGETARRADGVIAISQGIRDLISNRHGVPMDKMSICPLGIELPNREVLSEHHESNRYNILFVGRLEKRKGLETLFKALPRVFELVPSAHMTLIGKDTYTSPTGGSYKAYLMSLIDKKFHVNIQFLGFVPDRQLQRYYRDCDVFVAPSLYESFGLIYLEAMSWGKPVIGCSVGGVPEIIENGVSGLIVLPDNPDELSEAILKLNDRNLRVKLGKHARQRVEKYFSLEHVVEKTLDTYRQVIQRVG